MRCFAVIAAALLATAFLLLGCAEQKSSVSSSANGAQEFEGFDDLNSSLTELDSYAAEPSLSGLDDLENLTTG